MIKKNNPINIITLIPLICFGLIIIGILINKTIFTADSNEMLRAMYNIISTFAYAGSILGIPIGIIYIKRDKTHPIYIIDIIIGSLIILLIIFEILIVLIMVKFAMIITPGIFEFFNGLYTIG